MPIKASLRVAMYVLFLITFMGVTALAQNNSLSDDNNHSSREEDKYIGVPETISRPGRNILSPCVASVTAPAGRGVEAPT